MSELVGSSAVRPPRFLVLDEVFGSLDESRRQNVIELLRRLSDRFEQVVVITHIESVREGLDRVVEVSYDEATGASHVSQTDGGARDDGAVVGRIGSSDLVPATS
jgi:exonuclease SbcC